MTATEDTATRDATGRPLEIIGLDPSLSSFGIARTYGPAMPAELHRVKPAARGDQDRGHPRMAELLNAVEEHCFGADLAVIEGIVMLAAGGDTHINLIWLHKAVCHRLWETGVPYAVVAPKTRAKYITGNGNAEKDACLAEVIRRFNGFGAGDGDPGLRVTGNDVADALTLAQMGCDYHGAPLVPMPAARTAALRASRRVKVRGTMVNRPVIEWPALREGVIP